MKEKLIPILGWYGVIAIISAYTLLSFGVLEVTDPIYQLLNLTGSIGILIDAFRDKDYQPVVINIFWAAIALISLAHLFFFT